MSVKAFLAAMSLKVKVIAVCTAVAVTSAAAVAVGVAVNREDTYRVLKVFEMTGMAVVDREGSGELEAYVGMNLESGDTLTVGDDSTLRISMDNDKYVLLDGGTILELTAAGTPSDSRTEINLKKGTILNEITNSLSANSTYEVSTPKATMAVRGTSFTVSVDEDSEGGYTIRENTFNGKVEVILLDSEGNKTENTAFVTADKGVTIRTERNESTGNPAEVDGTSRFVFEENGIISEIAGGANPVHEINYNIISAAIKENALRSNDQSIMKLDDKVVSKLRNVPSANAQINEQAGAAYPSVPETGTSPVQTSVPETSANSEESTQTAAAGTTDTSYSEPEITTVPENISETESSGSESVLTDVSSDTDADEETSVSETSAEDTASDESEITESLTETETSAAETTNSTSRETTATTLPETHSTSTPASEPSPNSSGDQITSVPKNEKETFRVQFMCEGKLIASEFVEDGETVANIPEIPYKTGYDGKWMYDGKEFTYATPVISDITVTAVYTIKTYTVTFTADADTPYSKTVKADHGTPLADILPDVPEKTGYTGVWKIGGTVNISGGITVTSDLNIKAVYTIKTFTVTFNCEGSVYDTRTVDYGKSVSDIPELPEKTGYTGKWIYKGSEFTSSTIVTSDITVNSVYYIKTYTVTFTADADESYTKTVAADHGTLLEDILPDVPEKTGYTGVWKIGGTVNISGGITVTSDLSIKAVYTINTYTVTFTAEGSEDITRTVDYGKTVSDIPEVPEKTGYTGKWTYNDSEFTSAVVITSDITVEAVYNINSYTVTFKAEGSTDITRTAEYGKAVSNFPAVPEKTGYNGKWIYGGEEFTSETPVTSDITVTAVYTIKTYTVTFTAEGSSDITRTVEHGKTVSDIPSVPSKTGYTGKWMYDGSAFTSSTVVTSDITVEAVYTAKSYTVKFVPSYDTSVTLSTQSVKYGKKPTAYTPDTVVETAEGKYYLWGWEEAFAAISAVTKDVTITVPYKDYGDIYEVRVTDNGSHLLHKLYCSGDTLTLPSPTNTTVNGFSFKGWGQIYSGYTYSTGLKEDTSVSESGSIESGLNEKSTYSPLYPAGHTFTSGSSFYYENVQFVAAYLPTVTFVDDDGTQLNTCDAFPNYDGTYNMNSSDMPAAPEKNGITAKWMYNGSEFTYNTKITGNVTVEAVYKYTVTLVPSYDESITLDTLSVSSADELSDFVPDTIVDTDGDSKYDYYLWGWDDVLAANSNITGDVTIIVPYKDYGDIYEVRVTENESHLIHELYCSGDTLTLPSPTNTTSNGLSFKGWGQIYSGYTYSTGLKKGTSVSESGSIESGSNEKSTYSTLYPAGHTITNKSVFYYENVQFVAAYLPTVTFVDDNGTQLNTCDALPNYNGTYSVFYDDMPDAPEKNGYTGTWIYNGFEFDSNTEITENITVTAKYPELVTVTFQFASADKDPVVYTIPKGTTLGAKGYTVPTPDAKKYHYSTGWLYSGDMVDTNTVFNETVTLTPLEIQLSYGLIFYDSDGTTPLGDSTTTVTYEIKILSMHSSEPSTGGIFSHWEAVSEDGSSSMPLDSNTTVADVVDALGIRSTIKVVAVYVS